jgi:hypothetical protein
MRGQGVLVQSPHNLQDLGCTWDAASLRQIRESSASPPDPRREYSLLDVTDEREAAGLVGRVLAELFVEETYPGVKVLDAETKTEDKRLVEVVAEVDAGGRVFMLRHLPWAMRFRKVYSEIPQFFPFFSERVSMLFRRLLEKLAGKDLRDIDAVMKRLESEAAEEYNNSVWKELSLHKSQVDNFVRGMNMI